MTRMSSRHLSNDSAFESQRIGHFEVEIDGFPGGDQLKLMMQTAFTPGESSEVIEVPFMNERSKYAGGTIWEDGEIAIRDFVDLDTQGMVSEWRNLVRDVKSGAVHLTGEYKKDGYILLVSPDGEGERKWKLRGVWPSAIGSQTLEQGDYEKLPIAVTLTFDKAEYIG